MRAHLSNKWTHILRYGVEEGHSDAVVNVVGVFASFSSCIDEGSKCIDSSSSDLNKQISDTNHRKTFKKMMSEHR